MGIATLIQTTLGNRLPIVQGPSATLTAAIKSVGELGIGGPALWGGIFVGGFVEMAIGGSQVLKYLRKLFPIGVAGVVVVVIGLSLGQVAVRWVIGDGKEVPFSPLNFLLAGSVIALMFFLQLGFPKALNGIVSRGAVFFSIWIVGLLMGGLLGKVKWEMVSEKAWFSFPGIFPYGGPGFGWEFTTVAILGILVGYFGSMVESIGDYAATCAVSGVKYKVDHMNRGIFAEGLSCLIASALGSLPVTSYTQNIGIIATTKVASRFVVRVAAVILILYGLCPKFGALLVAIPRPVLGGVFLVVCGMIAMSGIKLLSAAKNSTANSLMIGTTLICSLSIPFYVKLLSGSESGKIWLHSLPSLVTLLLSNPVVLALLMGVFLNLLFQAIDRQSARVSNAPEVPE